MKLLTQEEFDLLASRLQLQGVFYEVLKLHIVEGWNELNASGESEPDLERIAVAVDLELRRVQVVWEEARRLWESFEWGSDDLDYLRDLLRCHANRSGNSPHGPLVSEDTYQRGKDKNGKVVRVFKEQAVRGRVLTEYDLGSKGERWWRDCSETELNRRTQRSETKRG